MNKPALEPEDIIALIPAGGWRGRWVDNDGIEYSEPLVAWGLQADGDIVPLETDSAGMVLKAASNVETYHPDASQRVLPVATPDAKRTQDRATQPGAPDAV